MRTFRFKASEQVLTGGHKECTLIVKLEDDGKTFVSIEVDPLEGYVEDEPQPE